MERFTISLDERLAGQFDAWLAAHRYANRSEAVRDLVRAAIGRSQQEADGAGARHCVACLSYVFNHHERDLAERLTAIHHAHHDLTISTMHAHLDHDHCLETVILRGPSARVVALADALSAERGVHHGKLNLIGVDLHERHAHDDAAKGHAGSHVHLKPSA